MRNTVRPVALLLLLQLLLDLNNQDISYSGYSRNAPRAGAFLSLVPSKAGFYDVRQTNQRYAHCGRAAGCCCRRHPFLCRQYGAQRGMACPLSPACQAGFVQTFVQPGQPRLDGGRAAAFRRAPSRPCQPNRLYRRAGQGIPLRKRLFRQALSFRCGNGANAFPLCQHDQAVDGRCRAGAGQRKQNRPGYQSRRHPA